VSRGRTNDDAGTNEGGIHTGAGANDTGVVDADEKRWRFNAGDAGASDSANANEAGRKGDNADNDADNNINFDDESVFEK